MPMDIHQVPIAAALAGLGSSPDCLSQADALRRLRQDGPNQFGRLAPQPALLRLLPEFVQFFSVILWVAAALAFLAEWYEPGQGMAGVGYEQPDAQAMQRPPRPQHDRLLNLSVALRSYLFLGIIEAATAMAAFFFVLLSGGWHYGEILRLDDPLYLRATTACLSAIIAIQIVGLFVPKLGPFALEELRKWIVRQSLRTKPRGTEVIA